MRPGFLSWLHGSDLTLHHSKYNHEKLDGWVIDKCRAGGTDEKTLWSNLLVSILSDITNTTTRPERESCLAPKRFSGVKNYFVFYETIFSRITLCTFGSRADSDSFNIPTVIQQPSLRLNSPDRFRSLLFSNELREKFQALNTG